MERTLFIVKPDAVERNLTGYIISQIEEGGLRIIALRMTRLSPEEAGRFYGVHKSKPFYEKLVSYMTSGRCVAAVAEGTEAIERVRTMCGATNPAEADEGTIRASFGLDLTRNSVHASDSPATAKVEVGFFFPDLD
jgi:nucleoside-diphosphate kinase